MSFLEHDESSRCLSVVGMRQTNDNHFSNTVVLFQDEVFEFPWNNLVVFAFDHLLDPFHEVETAIFVVIGQVP